MRLCLLAATVYAAGCRIVVKFAGHCRLVRKGERVDHGFSVARQAEAGLLFEPRLDDVLDVGTPGTIGVDMVQLHLRHAVIRANGTCR